MTTATDAVPKTSVLQMVRAEVNAQEFRRWMGVRRLEDPDHAMHCLLTECFGDLAPKPFRLILGRDAPTGVLYGYGSSDADALRETSAICADPLQCRIVPANSLDSKPMPAEWQAGKRIGFEVRIRPIVRLLKDPSIRTEKPPAARLFNEGGNRPGTECDVFLWEAMRHPNKGDRELKREQVYAEWLLAKLERSGGASLDVEATKLVSFQRTRSVRKLHARHSEGPDAVMRGTLTVTDPAAFAALLAKGIGRHRAYGYGMLLLRPA